MPVFLNSSFLLGGSPFFSPSFFLFFFCRHSSPLFSPLLLSSSLLSLPLLSSSLLSSFLLFSSLPSSPLPSSSLLSSPLLCSARSGRVSKTKIFVAGNPIQSLHAFVSEVRDFFYFFQCFLFRVFSFSQLFVLFLCCFLFPVFPYVFPVCFFPLFSFFPGFCVCVCFFCVVFLPLVCFVSPSRNFLTLSNGWLRTFKISCGFCRRRLNSM